MKKLLHISLPVLFSLCTVFAYAERETKVQSFGTMYSFGDLIISDGNTTGATDLLTYTCTRSAEFGYGAGSLLGIDLAKSNGTVTTTKVNELIGFQILSRPISMNTKVKVYVSKTGVFEAALSGDNISYGTSGEIDVTIPRGNYYIKIVNTDGSNLYSLIRIEYYLDHCNCFEYIPE